MRMRLSAATVSDNLLLASNNIIFEDRKLRITRAVIFNENTKIALIIIAT